MSDSPSATGLPMARRRPLGVFNAIVWIALVGACSSSPKRDLQFNDRFYASPNYRTAVLADRQAFLAPVKDVRDDRAAIAAAAQLIEERAERSAPTAVPLDVDATETGVSTVSTGVERAADSRGPRTARYVQWASDGIWERTPAQMVDGILRDELEDSGVFAGLAETAEPQALLVQPSLFAFRAGQQPYVSGYSSLAECGLRIEVFGPVGANGSRDKLLDDVYVGRVQSPVMFRPPSVAQTLGSSVGRAMLTLLSEIDESNVARSAFDGTSTAGSGDHMIVAPGGVTASGEGPHEAAATDRPAAAPGGR